MRRIAVLGRPGNRTTEELVEAWQARGVPVVALTPAAAAEELRAGDVALGRLDVRRSLDGVEPGLLALLALEARGVEVLNGARALVAVHDKLRTASLLRRAAVPHPATIHARGWGRMPVAVPVVVKPRFGSWGRDVLWCDDPVDVELALRSLARTRWFRRHGAVVQEAVPPAGFDLRLVVAGGRVLATGRRQAAAGEWRTNVSLGGTLTPAEAPAEARELAATAAAVVGADLVGVDLLPLPGGGFTVLELNGAVEFDDLAGADLGLYDAIGGALGLIEDETGMRAEQRLVPAGGTIAS